MRRWLLGAFLLTLSCSTYRDHLTRGQRLYQLNKYHDALALWRVLEPDLDSLEHGDRARYAYLRGMTDFRLGYRAEARHWLAIAKAMEQQHPGGLPADWPTRVDAALAELNRDVFGAVDGNAAAPTPPSPAATP